MLQNLTCLHGQHTEVTLTAHLPAALAGFLRPVFVSACRSTALSPKPHQSHVPSLLQGSGPPAVTLISNVLAQILLLVRVAHMPRL